MEELEKSLRANQLFDCYGKMLTEHQQNIFKLYFEMDLSLSEIAEELNISRNGVHDAIKKSLSILENYEDKLGLINKQEQIENYLRNNNISEDIIDGVIERIK
jgi:predicted DNA-binding protein YlxM (UPF0122 family)